MKILTQYINPQTELKTNQIRFNVYTHAKNESNFNQNQTKDVGIVMLNLIHVKPNNVVWE